VYLQANFSPRWVSARRPSRRARARSSRSTTRASRLTSTPTSASSMRYAAGARSLACYWRWDGRGQRCVMLEVCRRRAGERRKQTGAERCGRREGRSAGGGASRSLPRRQTVLLALCASGPLTMAACGALERRHARECFRRDEMAGLNNGFASGAVPSSRPPRFAPAAETAFERRSPRECP